MNVFRHFGKDGEVHLDWDDELVEIACNPHGERIYVEIAELYELMTVLDEIKDEVEKVNPYLLVPPLDNYE